MTKSIIIVTNQAGSKGQYFRNGNSEIERMGKMLESFATSAAFMGNLATDNHFSYLLGMEKDSAFERAGTLHGGVDYCWYVELKEGGARISYSEVAVKDFDGIQHYLRLSEGEKNI